MSPAALAFSMGKSLDDIRHGLRTFDTTFFQAPGRMNIHDEHPFKVILDYGHNPAAMRAVCQLVDRLDVSGQRTVVLSDILGETTDTIVATELILDFFDAHGEG